LNHAAVSEVEARNRGFLVVGDEGAIFPGDTETMDVEFGFSSESVVEVVGGALNVDGRFSRQSGDSFACHM
jgi:hypothetical protein